MTTDRVITHIMEKIASAENPHKTFSALEKREMLEGVVSFNFCLLFPQIFQNPDRYISEVPPYGAASP